MAPDTDHGFEDFGHSATRQPTQPTPALFEDELAVRFTARLRLFASRRLNDPTAAEDVAQETLHRVVEALRANRIENLDALPGFVFQTARNICLHRIRGAVRERTALARFELSGHGAGGTSGDVLDGLITEERRERVKCALGGLGRDDSALLAMVYYESLDTEIIAAHLALTPTAVRVRKHRALRRLAELLNHATDGNESTKVGTPD